MIRTREGLAYVLASVVQASCDVLVLAINRIIEGEIDPMIAFKINWSCRIQRVYAGFGDVLLLAVTVAEGHGLEPSIYPRRS